MKSFRLPIKRRDVIKLPKRKGSPLDVNGIKTKLSRQEILKSIKAGRKTL